MRKCVCIFDICVIPKEEHTGKRLIITIIAVLIIINEQSILKSDSSCLHTHAKSKISHSLLTYTMCVQCYKVSKMHKAIIGQCLSLLIH